MTPEAVILPINQALDLQSWIPEIGQQTQPEARRLQMVHTLSPVDCIQRVDRFQPDQDSILDQQIRPVCAGHHTVIMDRDVVLLRNRQSILAQFISEGILIHFSRMPTPSVFETTNAHPMIFSDRSVRAAPRRKVRLLWRRILVLYGSLGVITTVGHDRHHRSD